MVETNDDVAGGETIGTRDGSINIVSWREKVWIANKKADFIQTDWTMMLIDYLKRTNKYYK